MKKRSAAPVTPIKPATSTADSFQNFAARLGYGAGNLTDASRYSIEYLSRNRFQLEAMYRSSWICGKAVDSVAEDMTKRGIEINSEAEPGDVDQLQEYWKTLKLWDAIADTIKWGRLYGGAVAVMLIDGQNLATPLRVETVKRDQFKGLCVLDRWQVQPSLDQLVQTLGPDLGIPTFYTVFGASRALSSAKIHYSRVIRIDGQDLPYWQAQAENLWGQSVIERLFDRLLAFDSTTQGAAQLVFKAHLRTYKVEGLRDIIAAGGQVLQGLTKQMDFMRMTQTNEGLTLMDTKDEFEAHSYTFSGLDTVLLQFAQQLSGALDIPLTRLFGQSPAGLNSTGESDMRNYYDGIAQQQERRLRTGVKVLLALTNLSLFGKPMPEGSGFTFRPLWQMSDIEKGQLAATLTTAITSACTSSIVGRQTALKELRQQSRLTGIWTNIADEDIAAADNDVDTGGEFGDAPLGDDEEDLKKKLRTQDDEWKESDHPRDPEGKFSFAAMLEQTKRDLAFHEERVSFLQTDLARAEKGAAQTQAAGKKATFQRQVKEMKASIAGHSARVETLKRDAKLFSDPSKQIRFAAETQVGGSSTSERLHRQVVAAVHHQLPKLAEDLRRNGYMKKLVVGEELFEKQGLKRNHSNANGLYDKGSVYIRRHGETKAPDDPRPLWESPSVRYHQSEPEKAALALFLHEAAHLYYFKDPGVGGDANPKLQSLFAKATDGGRTITDRAGLNEQEYFAESFAAAHLDPAGLDKRDPEMADFMRKFLATKGMSQR